MVHSQNQIYPECRAEVTRLLTYYHQKFGKHAFDKILSLQNFVVYGSTTEGSPLYSEAKGMLWGQCSFTHQ